MRDAVTTTVIEMLAARVVDLEAERTVLIDMLADLTIASARLRHVALEEMWNRIIGDAALTRANTALRRAGLMPARSGKRS